MIDPRRVALVVTRLRAGGKEQCVVDLANGLAERGWTPVVISLEGAGPLTSAIRHPQVRFVSMEKRKGTDWRVPFLLANALRRERVAIAHSHNWGTQLEVALAGRLAGVPALVHTQHGLDFGVGETRGEGRGFIRRWLKRASARAYSAVVAVSEEVRADIRREWGVHESRLFLIHNGVHVPPSLPDAVARDEGRRRLGIGPSEVAIGTVGIFRPVKNFELLIEAFSTISTTHPEAILLLVGDGPLREELKAAALRSGAGDRIRFLGLRRDVPQILPCLDIYALPSISEGLSISILEAMASALPVVATRVGGNGEAVEDGQTGTLVPSGSPEALAAGLRDLITDADRRHRMGEAGRRRVLSQFTVAHMLSEYERIYGTVAPRDGARLRMRVALDALLARGGGVLGSPGALELIQVRTLERPLSLLSWVEARSTETTATLVIKVPGSRADADPRAVEKAGRRYAEEESNLRRLGELFQDVPGLSVVRPLACLPGIPALATFAVPGENLRDRITRGARWPTNPDVVADLAEATRAAGRWLAVLRERTTVSGAAVAIEEMAAYADVRLKRLATYGRKGIDETVRGRVLHAFDRAARQADRLDRTVCGVHGDLALSNLIWGDGRITIIDVTSYREGSRYLDPTRVHHQLGLYRTKPLYLPDTILRLQGAFWSGYGSAPNDRDPMLLLHLVQHTLTHWLGRLKVAPAGPAVAAYDAWVRRGHRLALERLLRGLEGSEGMDACG